MSEKETHHQIMIGILAEHPITGDEALFAIRKSINNDDLDEKDIIITYARIDESYTPASPGSRPKPRTNTRFSNALNGLPGFFRKISPLLKGRKWWHYYVGFAGVVLGLTLLYKWIIRLFTGTF